MTVEIIAAPNPFTTEVLKTEAPEGLSIAEMLTGRTGPLQTPYGLHVFLGDALVPQDLLHLVRPKSGARITVRVVPGDGGGGGDGGKDTLRTVLTIAVIAAAIFAPYALPLIGLTAKGIAIGTLTYGALATAVVGTVGLMAVNALVPPRLGPSTLAASSGVQAEESPNYSISGARNAPRPFGVVPVVLGTNRVVPPLGAQTFTEILGGEQYLRMLVIWGYGPLDISDIRIGETPIADFDDVTIQTREGRDSDTALTLYPDTVTETSLAVALTAAAGYQTRTTVDDTDEISVDITFPAGLVAFDDNGLRTSRTVQVLVEFRTAGSGSFSSATTFNVTEASTQPVRRGLKFTVSPRGKWDVRLKRTTADNTDPRVQDAVTWTTMRAFTNEDPDLFESDLAKSAIRIKATDQLNAAVDQINSNSFPRNRT